MWDEIVSRFQQAFGEPQAKRAPMRPKLEMREYERPRDMGRIYPARPMMQQPKAPARPLYTGGTYEETPYDDLHPFDREAISQGIVPIPQAYQQASPAPRPIEAWRIQPASNVRLSADEGGAWNPQVQVRSATHPIQGGSMNHLRIQPPIQRTADPMEINPYQLQRQNAGYRLFQDNPYVPNSGRQLGAYDYQPTRQVTPVFHGTNPQPQDTRRRIQGTSRSW